MRVPTSLFLHWVQAVAIVALCAILPAHAAVHYSQTTLVGTASEPVSRAFTIATQGTYELELTDVGFPAPLTSLQAAVTRGGERIAVAQTLDQPVTFTASPGEYAVQVAGLPSAATGLGTFAVRVTAVSSGATPLDYSDVIEATSATPQTGQRTLQTSVTLTAAGPHRITLSDIAFPVGLDEAELLLTRDGTEQARLSLASSTADFEGTAGDYDLLLVAQAAAPAQAGLLAIRVTRLANGVNVLARSYAVGTLSPPSDIALPASGSHQLTAEDLRFPAALATASAALVRGADVLAVASAAGGPVTFAAAAGSADLYALPLPASGTAVGSMTTVVTSDGTVVHSGVDVATPSSTAATMSLFNAPFHVAAAGSIALALTDFEFPSALADLQVALVQHGAELGRRAGAGTLTATAVAGEAQVVVAAKPGSNTAGGLYGVRVTAGAGGGVLYETTQAAGALLRQVQVTVPSTGSQDVTLTDLDFPVEFDELAAAVTRGTSKLGFVFGADSFSFEATPGDYFLNVIARVDAGAKFGAFGATVAETPPAPTVTLNAADATVDAGDSTTLTWSTTGASSCVASGQWTGARPTSGSESVGPINAQATYTLSCTGAGGNASQSVTVAIRSGSEGGGGAVAPWVLALLLIPYGTKRRARVR